MFFFSVHTNPQVSCPLGFGLSAGSRDSDVVIKVVKCKEGITQCTKKGAVWNLGVLGCKWMLIYLNLYSVPEKGICTEKSW